jgi:hypothetical protein
MWKMLRNRDEKDIQVTGCVCLKVLFHNSPEESETVSCRYRRAVLDLVLLS